MHSSTRIFSLPLNVQVRLQEFINDAERNGLLSLLDPAMVGYNQPEPLSLSVDESGLTDDNYRKLYEMLGVAPHIQRNLEQFTYWLNRKRETSATVFMEAQKLRAANKVALRTQRQAVLRRSRPIRKGRITASGAVTILLNLAMDTLEERSRCERKKDIGNQGGDVRRPEEKRVKPAARKAAAA